MTQKVFRGIGALVVAVVVFAAFPVHTLAQRNVEADIGIAVPSGKLGDVSGTGLSVGIDAFYRFIDAMPNLRGGVRVAYNAFGENTYPDAASSASTIEILPSLRYLVEREGRSGGYFAQAGLGMFISSFNYDNIPGAEDDTDLDFGFSVAIGTTYQVTDSFAIVAMPVFNFSDSRYFSLNVGVIFGKRKAEPDAETVPESLLWVQ